ncbi:MAG: MFS transporter [Hyphomicrobiales bacterium]|nr:MFS transporter [Hyphomicrobiales bacterium]MDE2116031.1 MFS transporter [Hyphomicrobiales bacterium]
MPATSVQPQSLAFTLVYATGTTITFSAVSSAPTPIYRLYQEGLGLTPLEITLIFAIYTLTMIATFLTIARLSDFVGRKPMIFAALALNALALALFLAAGSAQVLMAARAAQGVATGIALATLGATIADTAPKAAATLNSVTAFIGLTAGSLLAGALVAYAPWPTQLTYALLLAVTIVEMGALVFIRETAPRKIGGWGALRPNLTVPPAAIGAMMRLFPLTLSAWALGGFYLSLMPSLVIAATGVRSPLLGAAVVSALMLTGGLSVFAFRSLAAARAVRASALLLAIGIIMTVFAIRAGSAVGMVSGTVIAGFGFGGSYGAALRTLLPLAANHERAGLLSAYFVVSYLAFALPAVVAGLAAPHFGLVATSLVYGSVLALCALATLVIETFFTRAAAALS